VRRYDAIVIGSGFGGAITALRLQESGYRVLVLERGRRWDRTNYPRGPGDPWIWDPDAPERRNGWLELRRFPHMSVAAGAAVGGGSLIYANVSCEAPPWRFQKGWPPEITYEELKPHYDTVKAFMDVRVVPDNQWTPRMLLMKEAAERVGLGDRFRKLELAVTFDDAFTYADLPRGLLASVRRQNAHGAEQGTCVHCGDCDIGCEAHAKNTLDRNYLFAAESRGAEVRALHLVTGIEPLAGGGYRVAFDRLEPGEPGERVAGVEEAGLVVVAAGSLGSTELLLRCRDVTRTLPDLSPFLGRGWSSNGDFLTPALYASRAVEPTRGPTIGSVIDLYEEHGGQDFWIEDGGLPNAIEDYVARKDADPETGIEVRAVIHVVKRLLGGAGLRGVMPWFAQGVDAGDGVLSLRRRSLLDPRPELHLDWDIEQSKPVIESIVDMHRRLSLATGGEPLVPPTWSLFRRLVTPHPLGGCNMGRDRATGVVDHAGAVFGYPGLFVADGAIVPEALGVNPSRTIGALAERIAARIAVRA
jgi:cholesterol oxidase